LLLLLINSIKFKTKIIAFIITWDGIVTISHKRYIKEKRIPLNVEAYIQSRVLKKTLESIPFDRRRNLVKGNDIEGEAEEAMKRLTVTETCERGSDKIKFYNICFLILICSLLIIVI
jgi:hypothetical protein